MNFSQSYLLVALYKNYNFCFARGLPSTILNATEFLSDPASNIKFRLVVDKEAKRVKLIIKYKCNAKDK